MMDYIVLANVHAEHHSDGFQKIPKGFLETGLVCDSCSLLVSADLLYKWRFNLMDVTSIHLMMSLIFIV